MQAKAVLRILVVEDHADTGDCMAMLLRLYGDDVAVARDGPAGRSGSETGATASSTW
jgi:CheY-like chemotaxis protein